MILAPLVRRASDFLRRRPGLEHILDRLFRPLERIIKVPIFGCHMCGQCVLHSTGMTCPMTCPKQLRNGPCGGVRMDGHCEVYPERACIWVRAYNRSTRWFWPQEFHNLQPPVDWALKDSSSWVNLLTGRDRISSGCAAEPKSALQMLTEHVE